MNLLTEALAGLGAALLPLVAALLFEELTFGGLVRLLIAPWPGNEKLIGHKRQEGKRK
jgi:DNA-binding transcriptional LysR family regulator